MNNKVKKEKIGKLSIASLIIGLLAGASIIYSIVMLILYIKPFEFGPPPPKISWVITFGPTFILGVISILLGTIDLIKIKKDKYSKKGISLDIIAKGRGFDIVGIVLGGIFILFALVLLAENTIPH